MVEIAWLADLGTTVGWSTRPGFYFGSTLELPIALEGALPIAERNRNLRIVSSRTEIAPFLGVRCYFDHDDRFDNKISGVSFGVVLRVKYSTDVIDLGTR